MGKSKKFKKPLKNGCLTANVIIDEVKVTDSLITWNVKNYSELHLYVYYFAIFKKRSTVWRLSMRKVPFSLYVFLSTHDYVDDIDINIRGSNGEIMDKRSAINQGRSYCAMFDEQKILPPSGKLIDDILTAQFVLNSRPREKSINVIPGLTQCPGLKQFHTSEVDILFNNLRQLYFSGKLYDFILEVGNVKFKVHKLILFKHCKYLARKVKEDEKWPGDHFDICANAAMMHEVLLYIYSGELTNLDIEGMRDVYFIAASLEISSLLDICIHFFRSILTVNNVYNLFVTSLFHDNKDFQKEIILFLNKQPETVRKTRAWAEAIRDILKCLPEELRGLYKS